MKFTPQALLSTPRRDAGLARQTAAAGVKILYRIRSYSFQSHTETTQLRVRDTSDQQDLTLAEGDGISDPNWLSDDEIIYFQSAKGGTTDVLVASVGGSSSSYVAATIDASAGNLRIKDLGNGRNFAFVFSAQAAPDGTLYNKVRAPTTHATGMLYSQLYVRHWDRYETREKNSLWHGKLSKTEDQRYRLSTPANALLNLGVECPILPYGGTDHFDISAKRIIFIAKDPNLNPALNTKCNIYVLTVDDWQAGTVTRKQKIETAGFEGAVDSPIFSIDGTQAAYVQMRKNGYEADKNEIFVFPVHGGPADPTPVRAFSTTQRGTWDRSPGSLCFTADGHHLLCTAADEIAVSVFLLPTAPAEMAKMERPRRLTVEGSARAVTALPGLRFFASGTSLLSPSTYTIYDVQGDAEAQQVWYHSSSHDGEPWDLSRDQISTIRTPANNREVNETIQSIVLHPSDFDPLKKYPVAYFIHGGPQDHWSDGWSVRWSLVAFAELGYIVVAPNITGSTGYGQRFVDAIRQNWGGDPYGDIVRLFDWVGENMPGADNERAVALGASFGGYMMNWIQGHDLGRKMKCLVCHNGCVSDFTGGKLTTEELYFPFHDLGGAPCLDKGYNPEDGDNGNAAQAYRNFGQTAMETWHQWAPEKFYHNWATPELVVHSPKDFRIPIAEGLAAFHALQIRDIESQFLTFPEENHWMNHPENSLVWYKTVMNWINRHVGLPAFASEDAQSEEYWGGVKGEPAKS